METFDLTIIGSGLACTTTLCSLIDQLTGHPPVKPLRIAIIEQHEQLWTGIAYGKRSAINSLTITSLKDFLTNDTERSLFVNWLRQNLKQWIAAYQQNGGPHARQWVRANLAAMRHDSWDDLYLPRHLFGQYMVVRLRSLLAEVTKLQLLTLTTITAEATSVNAMANHEYQVELKANKAPVQYIRTRKLVLACGSLPIHHLKVPTLREGQHICVQNLYQPSVAANLASIEQALIAGTGKSNVLIVGANASAMELLYLLYRSPVVNDCIDQIVIVSPGGRLPGRVITQEHKNFDCRNLYNLTRKRNRYDIHTLLQAAIADLHKVTSNGVYIPLVGHFMNYVLKLMKPMPYEQKRLLYTHYGHIISKLIRRAGSAYRRAVNRLVIQQKLFMLNGRYLGLVTDDTEGCCKWKLKYKSAKTDKVRVTQADFNVVVNCSGSSSIEKTTSTLISSLLRKNVVKPNGSHKGLKVNEQFEAAPNLYVMGPLLGGNMNSKIHFWHLESASRLLYLAPMLAQELLKTKKAVLFNSTASVRQSALI